MKSLILLFTLLFAFTFIIITSAQDSDFVTGKSTIFAQPEPAQGNSAGIDYNVTRINYVADAKKNYRISFDSDINEVKIEEIEFSVQEIVPLHTGTESIDFKEINYDDENPELNLSDFHYSMILEPRSYYYAWYVDYTWTDFQERLNTLGNQGFRIENIDTYGKNVFNYGGTWTQDGLGWAWTLNITSLNDFINMLNNWPSGTPRYRPIDFAINPSGSQLLYGAVAVSDYVQFAWVLNESNVNDFSSWVNTQYGSSRRLVDIEIYKDGTGNLMFAGISENGEYEQQICTNNDWNEFLTLHNSLTNAGYRLLDFCEYDINGSGPYYAGVWNNDGYGYNYILDDQDFNDFQNVITGYINTGFKPIMVEIFDADWLITPLSSVAVNSPNGGEVWPVGSTQNITWNSTAVLDVKIELSTNNGATWTSIVDSTPSNGIYSWVVTNTPSTQSLITIRDKNDLDVYDTSDSLFTIDQAGSTKSEGIPTYFALYQNYPNPFNPSTTISYSVPKLTFITIKIFDVLGNEITVLINDEKQMGSYDVEFDGKELPSGVYYYSIQAGTFTDTKKMILLK